MNHTRGKRHGFKSLPRYAKVRMYHRVSWYRQRQLVLTLARRGACATLNAVLVCQTVSVREIRDVL